MRRRNFLKLVGALLVVPSIPLVAKASPTPAQYGVFERVTPEEWGSKEYRSILKDRMLMKIKSIPLRYPYNPANLVLVEKPPNPSGDPYDFVGSIGCKYNDNSR